MRDTLSAAEARHVAIAAQGLARPRPAGRVTLDHVRRAVHRLGLVQIDSVSALVPAHYQPLFSRLGPYDRRLLDALAYERRELTEQWAHEAAIVPAEVWPLLRHRMERHRCRPTGFEAFLERHADYAAWVLEQVRSRGPLSADEVAEPEGVDRRLDRAWFGTIPRAVLEAHFGRGLLAVAGRRRNGARVFDLPERVLPAHHDRAVPAAEAQRELLRRAARACGVATARDLADYWRMSPVEARPRIAELVDGGELREVAVEGWREPAYLHAEAALPRRVGARALLSPFDPVVWFRPRAERLFGFEYRIEIYTPEPQRRWGYYVLPFLLDDRLVARVDLKADRTGGELRVQAAHAEGGIDAARVAAALAEELRLMASWLGLDDVAVARRGDLAGALARAARSVRGTGV
jgi:uncharacterized protein